MPPDPTHAPIVSSGPVEASGPVTINDSADHDPMRPGIQRQHQATDPSRPADTTFEQDLSTASQRAVNLIWETKQGDIALYVIVGTMAIDGTAILATIITGHEMTAAVMAALGFVNSLATGVVSFYFSRTNHTAIGGVGPKPTDTAPYVGR